MRFLPPVSPSACCCPWGNLWNQRGEEDFLFCFEQCKQFLKWRAIGNLKIQRSFVVHVDENVKSTHRSCRFANKGPWDKSEKQRDTVHDIVMAGDDRNEQKKSLQMCRHDLKDRCRNKHYNVPANLRWTKLIDIVSFNAHIPQLSLALNEDDFNSRTDFLTWKLKENKFWTVLCSQMR